MTSTVRLARAWVWLLVLCGSVSLARSSGEEKVTRRYFVQVVLGSDSTTPPRPGSRPVGRVLHRKLARVFRWNNYWETRCEEVTVSSNQPKTLQVDKERRVEIEFVSSTQRQVRLYKEGRLTRKSTSAIANPNIAIHGWDSEDSEGVFLVIRQDRPRYEDSGTAL